MGAAMASGFKKAQRKAKSKTEDLVTKELNDIPVMWGASYHLSVECQQGPHDRYTTAGVGNSVLEFNLHDSAPSRFDSFSPLKLNVLSG